MSTVDIHALAGPYALDAVNDIERAAFNRHLAGCEACADEVAELREVTARLGDLTWSAPPPRLRDAVLAEVRRTRQAPPGRGDRPAPAGARRWRRWTATAAAAVVLAVGAGAVTFAVQEQRVRDERAALEQARAEKAKIDAVLSAPDARLRAETAIVGGRVTIVVSDSLDMGVAVLSGLPAPGPDKAYQLWTIEGGKPPIDRGLLPAGASSATKLVAGVRTAVEFAVSLEPASGSAVPSVITTRLSLT
jgi:anti-sigma-K factor RskA